MIRSRRMRWAGYTARMEEKRNAYRLLVGKTEGKSPLGRTRRRWVDNIKMNLREIEWVDMNWLDLAQDRSQRKALVNLRVPQIIEKFLSNCTIGGYSRRAQLHEVNLVYTPVCYTTLSAFTSRSISLGEYTRVDRKINNK
jgi:hypothetical protein